MKQIWNSRQIVNAALLMAGIALAMPLWIPTMIARHLGPGDRFFRSCSQFLSLVPGLLGRYLRTGFYVMSLDACSWEVHIEFGTMVSHPQVRLGSDVYIGSHCTIGMCTIGNRTLLGSNVDILSGRHHHVEAGDSAGISRASSLSPIRIGADAWIGNSAVVMADIGDRAIVGAGSVVVKPIPPNSVAVGNPAIVKKQRLEMYR